MWKHFDTEAEEELEDGKKGNEKGRCDCKENWSFARERLLHSKVKRRGHRSGGEAEWKLGYDTIR